ncbi:mite group 2 allergen Tyr p 2-like [Phlebotomus argentipes]|uniref:mite group 2 allergen Tyr p 2-like n=1 Tax=Phlebotomus argentipes TaxID=94469 RepID=UPI0028930DB5|nr:mite group 2 allergen Tyr p 2-like [Phlebotomus argentipes]
MNKVIVLLLPFFLASAFAGYVDHIRCTRTAPGTPGPGDPPTWVWVEGCEGDNCQVRNGTDAVVRAGFSPNEDHHNLRFHIIITLVGIPIPIEQPEIADQACLLLDGGCPLIGGAGERHFEYRFEVASPIVGPRVLIELTLINSDTNQAIACAGVYVTITA